MLKRRPNQALHLTDAGAAHLATDCITDAALATLCANVDELGRVYGKTMNDKEFTDYWTALVNKKYHSTPADLSRDERIFYCANTFRGSVPRSGLVGYFENNECDVIRDAHVAIAVLGLPDVLRLLEEAQTIILNGNPLPETDQYLNLYDFSLPEEEVYKAMDDLDEKVQDIQNQLYLQNQAIYDALCRFADERSLRAPKG